MNDNDILEKDSQQLGMHLMQFEALCHFKLITNLVKIFKMNAVKPRYGYEAGLNAFVVLGCQLDASVFLYESIKHLGMFSDEAGKVFTEQPYYSDLEVIRNNIHTYFKNGGFAKRADTIIRRTSASSSLRFYLPFRRLNVRIYLSELWRAESRKLVRANGTVALPRMGIH